MSGRWQEVIERARQAMAAQAAWAEPKPRFIVGQRVTWVGGRTRRLRRGLILEVCLFEGWPPEYEVVPLNRDGSLGLETRKFQSELEAEDA